MKLKAPLALIALVMLITAGCGKRKPPLPPNERVAQRAEIAGFQRGSTIIVTWQMPARNARVGNLLNLVRADVYRLAEPVSAPLTLSEDEFADRSLLVAAIPLKDADFSLKKMSFTDTLEFAGQPVRLRYAFRFVNSSGQKAAFSNFFLIEPASRIASSPSSLSVELSQEAVRLTWMPPAKNVDGSPSANISGYNIYRSESKSEPAKLLNKVPVEKTTFDDRSFDFDKRYFYFVRAVSLAAEAVPVESAESNIVEVFTKDTFAPSAPAAITIAASSTSISIFFAANPESDISGYRVYRSIDASAPKQEWPLLTKELLDTNTFQDTNVESGRKYYYYLTAVDKRGNASVPSDVVSETVP